MKIEDILALAKAGFTSEEILKISEATKDTEEADGKPEKDNKEPEQQKEPDQPEKDKKKDDEQKEDDKIEKSLSKLELLLDNIQKANLRTEIKEPEKEKTEDILAQIINPPERKDKK